MKKKTLRLAFVLGAIFLFSGVTIISASSQFSISPKQSTLTITNLKDSIEMLIFISPQYSNDKEIRSAIETYIASVQSDINWELKIITINQKYNDYKKIDQIIEKYYEKYEIKACLMVGEDTDTAFGGESGYMKKPSTVPWFTTGGEDSYEESEQGIVCKPYTMDICISLLYPTNELNYEIKKDQIIYAFNKFCIQRQIPFTKDILVFESSDINQNSNEMYNTIENHGNLNYFENPSDMEIKKSLKESYSMYYVHGHSNPAGTDLNTNENGWFSADNIDELNTPFFGADGCYVGGWWSNKPKTKNLDSSINCLWYGSKIFTSKNIKTMVLGLLSQDGFSYPVSFIENALPNLIYGKTLAESMVGKTYLGENIIIGDPTFHYSI